MARPRRPVGFHPSQFLTLVILGGALMAVLGATYVSMLATEGSLTEYRSQWALGGAGYLEGQDLDSPVRILLFLPLGALYFLFSPLPWDAHNALAAIAVAQNLLVAYPVTVLAAWTLKQGVADRRAHMLLLFLGIAALLFGLVEGNAGTALRHRAQFFWVLIVLAAPGAARLGARIGALRAPASTARATT